MSDHTLKKMLASTTLLAALFLCPALANATAASFPYYQNFDQPLGDEWAIGGNWAVSGEHFHGDSGLALTDSPGGAYENDSHTSVTLDIFLANSTRPVLSFWHRWEMQQNADYGTVNISTDQGANWARIDQVTGLDGGEWRQSRFDLQGYRGLPIWIRFQVDTNADTQFDGWYIDDLRIDDENASFAFPYSDSMNDGDSARAVTKSLPLPRFMREDPSPSP